MDIASTGWSLYQLGKDPSLVNAGDLFWDLSATFVPFVPGSYAGRDVRGLNKDQDAVDMAVAANNTRSNK